MQRWNVEDWCIIVPITGVILFLLGAGIFEGISAWDRQQHKQLLEERRCAENPDNPRDLP